MKKKKRRREAAFTAPTETITATKTSLVRRGVVLLLLVCLSVSLCVSVCLSISLVVTMKLLAACCRYFGGSFGKCSGCAERSPCPTHHFQSTPSPLLLPALMRAGSMRASAGWRPAGRLEEWWGRSSRCWLTCLKCFGSASSIYCASIDCARSARRDATWKRIV